LGPNGAGKTTAIRVLTTIRVLILNRKRVVAEGTVAEATRRAAAPRRARFRVSPEHFEPGHGPASA
jgi:ABC-type Na+ transport system ATPase subunit NatA